jgi:hypothetical protein
MSKPQIIQRSEEVAKETVKEVVTGVRNEASATIREGFAQMFGIPLPDATVSHMKQQDASQTSAQIGQAEQQLNALKQNTQPKSQESPVAAILRKNTGMGPEQAKSQLKQVLFGEAQRIGQVSQNSEAQQEARRKQFEAEEEARKKQEDQDRLASPIGLPGSHNQSPIRPMVQQRQSTGETLKKRDT